ncbi:MAG: DUF2461 domain-containing protein [Chloroflexota bacterium]
MSLQITLDFLQQLSENNNKAWFDDHRKQYKEARDAFEDCLVHVIAGFGVVDSLPPLEPKDVMHRINRDIRFSKDKSPYNTKMSAILGPDGRKSEYGFYYIRIEPNGESIVSSGLKSPSSSQLQVFREAIDEDATPLREIIESVSFRATFGEVYGTQVKSAPRGFAKDHPEIDLLRFKEMMASRSFSDDEVAGDDFIEQVLDTCAALKPFRMHFDNLFGLRISS